MHACTHAHMDPCKHAHIATSKHHLYSLQTHAHTHAHKHTHTHAHTYIRPAARRMPARSGRSWELQQREPQGAPREAQGKSINQLTYQSINESSNEFPNQSWNQWGNSLDDWVIHSFIRFRVRLGDETFIMWRNFTHSRRTPKALASWIRPPLKSNQTVTSRPNSRSCGNA